ncbi:MAG TPA: hypothetical protein DDX99_09390 [Desulfofustis sp.]|nr:hypothetical protein [Desulfofustis sp.]
MTSFLFGSCIAVWCAGRVSRVWRTRYLTTYCYSRAMATRRKPKKPLTPLQENRLLKIVLGLVVLGFLWVLFAPGFGVVSLFSMRHKAAELRLEIDALAESNEELRLEIERLQNDRAYLERIAREEHGMLKENERVFDFSGKK